MPASWWRWHGGAGKHGDRPHAPYDIRKADIDKLKGE